MRWPVAVALVLAAVVTVQIAFATIAVRNADTVDPTYAKEKR